MIGRVGTHKGEAGDKQADSFFHIYSLFYVDSYYSAFNIALFIVVLILRCSLEVFFPKSNV